MRIEQENLIELEAPRRPVLRWHGGKWMIAKWIISHFPAHRIYVEPYGGAASVLMLKAKSYGEIYNDLDGDVVGVFRVLRDPERSKRLADLLRLTPWARTEFLSSYDETEDEIERARRTIIRSMMGFGTTGMMKKGTGFRGKCYIDNKNGVKDFQNYPAAIRIFSDRLREVIIENLPATELIGRDDSPETLYYIDPPYPHSTRTALRCNADFGRAYRHELHDSDHRKLGQILRLLKGMVIVSGYHCDLYDSELFSDWKCLEKDTHADNAKKRVECIWLNPAAVKALEK